MINQLKKSPDTNPYPHKFHVKMTISEFIAKYDPLCKEGEFLEE